MAKEEIARHGFDAKTFIDALSIARKDYYDAQTTAAKAEAGLRFERLEQMHHDLESRLGVLNTASLADRERIMFILKQYHDEQERAVILLDVKNNVRFEVLETDIQIIMATYAMKDNVEKATALAKAASDDRFVAQSRELDTQSLRTKDIIGHFEHLIDKTNDASKERLETMTGHLDAQVASQSLATRIVADTVDIRFQGIDKATALANEALNKRLESMNEFRDQLRDQAARFITRDESEVRIKTFNPIIDGVLSRINDLEQHKANGEGRVWAFGVVMTVLSIAISVALHFIK